jgi:adenylate cyclase class IV
MRIVAIMVVDSETKKDVIIYKFPEVTEIPEAQIPVKDVEHVIEMTKDLPFRPIYNLSETKLV